MEIFPQNREIFSVTHACSVPGPTTLNGVKALANSLGPCAGRIVIDVTNPFEGNMEIAPAFREVSAGEELAKHLPQSWVYKALNSVNREWMTDPSGFKAMGSTGTAALKGGPCTLFAGPDDPNARRVVEDMLKGT